MSTQPRGEVIASRRLPFLPRALAFWGAAGVLIVLLGGSAAVSPLYGVDQQAWHFSSAALTSVFAVYALALLVVLLFAGSLSDLVGRRPMMTIGLIAEAAAAVLLITAHGLAFLFGARLLQGVATGAAVGAIGAALIDLQPARRPALGATVNTTASNLALAAAAL
ncbi:MAG: MFS transporter, partial [Candidatus Dormibacteraceae bacterium]